VVDEATFDAFYASAFDRLVGQVYLMVGDRDEARDCVQEAFVRAWDHRRRLEVPAEAWVRTTAYRLAVSRWRRARLGRRAPDRALQVHDPVPGPDARRVALHEALRRLPEPTRRAIVLHHLCDLPVEQVAHETGSPVGTVKARLSRGRAALAQLLADDLPEVPRA
jgi:RNA polymerase sigma-70 factor (ECF subfamily)